MIQARGALGVSVTTSDESGEFEVRVKSNGRMTRFVYDHHPLDVVGWDGCLWPYAFNIEDFEPIAWDISDMHRVTLTPPAELEAKGVRYTGPRLRVTSTGGGGGEKPSGGDAGGEGATGGGEGSAAGGSGGGASGGGEAPKQIRQTSAPLPPVTDWMRSSAAIAATWIGVNIP